MWGFSSWGVDPIGGAAPTPPPAPPPVAQITSFTGLRQAVLDWLERPGDMLLDSRFEDFLFSCEQRMYYGYATEDDSHPLRSDPLRIVEMEAVDPEFVLQEIVPQPPGFLDLVSAQLNRLNVPLQIVSQSTMDGYGSRSFGRPALIAVSGADLRVKDDPAGATATLRWYRRLPPPTMTAPNAILTTYPTVYLYGCLLEAAIFTHDESESARFLGLYNAAVMGLNARTRRLTATSAPVIRLRGRTP